MVRSSSEGTFCVEKCVSVEKLQELTAPKTFQVGNYVSELTKKSLQQPFFAHFVTRTNAQTLAHTLTHNHRHPHIMSGHRNACTPMHTHAHTHTLSLCLSHFYKSFSFSCTISVFPSFLSPIFVFTVLVCLPLSLSLLL